MAGRPATKTTSHLAIKPFNNFLETSKAPRANEVHGGLSFANQLTIPAGTNRRNVRWTRMILLQVVLPGPSRSSTVGNFASESLSSFLFKPIMYSLTTGLREGYAGAVFFRRNPAPDEKSKGLVPV
jgi:hypothetical protein